jgi:hypothetical protein
VGGRIVHSEVGLRLDDAPSKNFAFDLSNENFTEQPAGNFIWRGVVPLSRERRKIVESSYVHVRQRGSNLASLGFIPTISEGSAVHRGSTS